MERAPPGEVVIGLDGGASAVRAWAVVRSPDGLVSVGGPASALYDRATGFMPLPLDAQRAGAPPNGAETLQAELCIAAAVETVSALAHRHAVRRLRLAACLPGLKSADGRGVIAALHLPRMPRYSDELEARLASAGLDTRGSLARLLGDGEACGLGEEHGAGGHLRGAREAVYIGGGSGLAEAFKIQGELVPPGERLPRAWELSRPERDFEQRLSATGINRAWAERACVPVPTRRGEYPEDLAAAGDARAAQLLGEVAALLAELVALRAAAWPSVSGGAALERVVLGQRLGLIAERASPAFRARLADELARRAGGGHHAVVVSRLREAAALGAASVLLP